MADAGSAISPAALDYEPDPARPEAQGMGGTAARGFAWSVVQMIVVKLLSLGSQVLLTRIWLSDADLGRAALTLAVAAFPALLQQGGLREVLIKRYRHYDRWSTAAFWMSLTFGVLATLLMIAAAPIAAQLLKTPELFGMILVASLAPPFAAVSSIAAARMEATFQFRQLSFLSVGEVLVTAATSISLAAAGAHAYSLIVPVPVVAAFRCLTMWSMARPRIIGRLRLRRWRFLYADSIFIFGGYVAWTFVAQGDYLILKLMAASNEIVGAYFFAFMLSTQTVAIFSQSLLHVLLPVLSHIADDPARQIAAFLRAVRLLAVMTLPLCVMQAALAEPGVRLVFGTKWMHAVPLLQILSLGMSMRVVAAPSHSMLRAQGRFAAHFRLLVGYAVVFVILVSTATYLWQAKGTAIGVAITILLVESYAIYLCVRSAGNGWAKVIGVFIRPLASSLVIGAIALACNRIPGSGRIRDLVVLILAGGVCSVVYVMLTRLLSPAEVDEIRLIVRRLTDALHARRARRTSGPAASHGA